jgi:hypothetical protein
MDISTDERLVKNPGPALARGVVAAAETELAEAERALAQLPGGPGTVAKMNAALPSSQRRIATGPPPRSGRRSSWRPRRPRSSPLCWSPAPSEHGPVWPVGAYRWSCDCSPSTRGVAG